MDKLLKMFLNSISEGRKFISYNHKVSVQKNTVITAEITPKFNLRGLILKIFQQSERYIAIKHNLAEITL